MNIEAEIVSNQITENENSFLSPCCEAPRPDGICEVCKRNQFEMATYQQAVCHHEMKKWTKDIQELKQDVDAYLRKTNPEGSRTPLASDKGEAQETVRRRKSNLLRDVRPDGKALVRS